MDTNPETGVAPMDGLLDALNETPDEVLEDDAPDLDASTEDETDDAPAEDSQEQPAADEEEIELDGEKLKVQKKVAEAIMRQQDYTKKTQEVADRRRVVEDKEQFLEAQQQFMSVASSEFAELQAMQKQLAQFAQVDWNALVQQDSQRALELNIARNNLAQQVQEKTQRVQGIAQHVKDASKKHEDNQRALSMAELERRVGKITDKERQRLSETAAELGIPAKAMWSPEVLHAVDLASKYLALQKAKPQAMKKVAAAPRAIKPQAQQPRNDNQAALDRLRKTGRYEHLTAFL
jgi:hypothetical protein